MVEIQVNRKKYKGVSSWEEMPCSLAAKLYAVPMPEKLKACYQVSLDKESGKKTEEDVNKLLETVTVEDTIKIWAEYYGEIISIWFDCDVSKLNSDRRTHIFNQHCLNLILGLHWTPTQTWIDKEFIELGEEKLYFPASKNVLGQNVPMAYETAITFAESADLQLNIDKFKGGQYEIAPNLVSILCRPKGEEYDEDMSLHRAEKLKDVKMDVAWQVFFCANLFLFSQEVQDQLYSQEEVRSNRKRLLKVRDWLKAAGTARYLTFQKNLEALSMSRN
jgi:hypothetical protein